VFLSPIYHFSAIFHRNLFAEELLSVSNVSHAQFAV
jgi:hypothetical protein